jgi:mono/diheme cytochrome c family protein
LRRWLLLLALAGAVACGRGDETLAERGGRAYVANCTACHHVNPALAGTLGPATAGSSRDLVEARVLRAEYPPGYQPKEDTALMQPLPFLADDIDALTAFLDEKR